MGKSPCLWSKYSGIFHMMHLQDLHLLRHWLNILNSIRANVELLLLIRTLLQHIVLDIQLYQHLHEFYVIITSHGFIQYFERN